MKDPYAVLGVDKNATDEQIKMPTGNLRANTIPIITSIRLLPISLTKR